ncbi:hypothetical protein BKM15_22240 [Pseudomonas syringae pv. syringae]|nr:hypothetical protein BKM15_22240 [Pseudomonas syringae pv. syringae]
MEAWPETAEVFGAISHGPGRLWPAVTGRNQPEAAHRERQQSAKSSRSDVSGKSGGIHCHETTSRLAEIFILHKLTKITSYQDNRMLMRCYHPKMEELAKKLK